MFRGALIDTYSLPVGDLAGDEYQLVGVLGVGEGVLTASQKTPRFATVWVNSPAFTGLRTKAFAPFK